MMKVVTKIILGVLIFGILAFIGFFVMLGFSLDEDSLCGNKILQTQYSPNQKYKLVVFERNCGATTAFSHQVSILEKDRALKNTTGDIFVIDKNSININWVNDKMIHISYQKDSKVFHKENNFKGIHIKFLEN